jgi:hypothetical protein
VGNLLILDGAITQSIDGTPKLTEYHYDDSDGTLTIDSQRFSVLSNPIDYQETSLGDWQTHDEVITLPPAIVKCFGIERVVAAKPTSPQL